MFSYFKWCAAEREKERQKEKISSICWFTFQKATVARAGSECREHPRNSSTSSTQGAGAYELGPTFTIFPKHINMELGQKSSNQDMNKCLYEMLASQAVDVPTILQHQPLK